LPLIGVNTFLPKEHAGDITMTIELIRSTEAEKNQQIANVEAFRKGRNARATQAVVGAHPVGDRSPVGARSAGDTSAATNEGAQDRSTPGTLTHLQSTARARQNLFEALLEAVKYNSLGQISHALYDVGGEYRRNM
jgi:isobutyryl-CoA mutase